MLNEKKYRHEYKYAINYADYLILRARLKAVAKPDAHADVHGLYHIRSLYFDNYWDKALREKIDGVDNREKFRIRYYNGSLDFIMLEKKCKSSGLCRKLSEPLTKEETKKILSGDTDWMVESKKGLFVEFYSKMKSQRLMPKTIVDYIREPYVYPAGNVRITFDSQLKTGVYQTDFIKKNIVTMNALEDKSIILEIKYDAYLPDVIRDMVQLYGRGQTAFSKYGACRRFG